MKNLTFLVLLTTGLFLVLTSCNQSKIDELNLRITSLQKDSVILSSKIDSLLKVSSQMSSTIDSIKIDKRLKSFPGMLSTLCKKINLYNADRIGYNELDNYYNNLVNELEQINPNIKNEVYVEVNNLFKDYKNAENNFGPDQDGQTKMRRQLWMSLFENKVNKIKSTF